MPNLSLFFGCQNLRSHPNEKLPTNSFELEAFIRKRNEKQISETDKERRTKVWSNLRTLNSSWEQITYNTELSVLLDDTNNESAAESPKLVRYKGPIDSVAIMIEQAAQVLQNARHHALLIDQLSIELAKQEILCLNTNNTPITSRDYCKAELNRLMPVFTSLVAQFLAYEEKIQRLNYGMVEFTAKDEAEMTSKYARLYASVAVTEADQVSMGMPVAVETTNLSLKATLV